MRKACATVHEAKLGGSSCCIPFSTVSYRMVSCDVRDIENGRFGGRGCASIAATHGSEREREDIRWCRAASQPETGPAESAYGMMGVLDAQSKKTISKQIQQKPTTVHGKKAPSPK